MANAYYDYATGSAGNDGLTSSTPKATRDQAVTVAGAGDKVIALDGTQTHESTHFVFDDDRVESGDSYRGATLAANTAETTRVARTSATLAAANNPFRVEDLIFDGTSGNGGAGVTQAFDIAQDAAEDIIVQMHGCHFISGTSYGLLISNRRGRVELVENKFSGTLNTRFLGATSSLSGDGNQVIDVQGVEIAPSAAVTGSKVAIGLYQVATPTNTLDLYFKGLRGTVDVGASATFTLLDVATKDNAVLSGFDVTLNVDDAATTVSAARMVGKGATYELSNGVISKGKIKFNSPVGFAISYGLSTTDSHITGGIVTGNDVIGKYYASATPHNYVMGQGTAGECKGNVSRDGYVGYLFSITDSCDASANLAYDCYGPSYYAKGTVAATIKDNIAICTGKYTQRDRGILAVAPQGATNTTAVTFQENLVIVADTSKIHSLAYIEDASQACTFTRNTYIIPDTVDVSTANLFSYENGIGGAANNTLAQWNAQTEVTDDVIVQLPASEISALIATYKNQLQPVPNLMISTSGALKQTVGWKAL